jgi:hypothetical protein
MYKGCTKDVWELCADTAAPEIEFEFGSGTGTRTLNLAVNRSLQPVQKWRFEFAECRTVPPNATVCHRRCCKTARLVVDLPGLKRACCRLLDRRVGIVREAACPRAISFEGYAV